MLTKKREYVVVSVGGSLIVPDTLDTRFLSSFRECVLDKVREGLSFFIIAGGGRTARDYQKAAESVRGDLTPDDVDWLGIHATRLNAHLMRSLFLENAQQRIITKYDRRITPRADIIIGAGWKPGHSTDYCAVIAAKKLGAKKLINLSNIDHVYTADPKKNPEAQKIEKIGWKEFRTLIPKEWDPGLSSPFDPIAAKESEALGLEVAIMNGKNINEFRMFLENKPFVGTTIS